MQGKYPKIEPGPYCRKRQICCTRLTVLLHSKIVDVERVAHESFVRWHDECCVRPGCGVGAGGYSYLTEPLWWAGLLSMVIGEVANFAAYAFAPAILVTPLGALSILVSAVLAHHLLNERLNVFGILGCVLCVTGSLAIVLRAPPESPAPSVLFLWEAVLRPGSLLYGALAVGISIYLVWSTSPEQQQSSPLIFVSVCSLFGSLTVVCCQALGIAIKLTLQGDSQLVYPPTYAFAMVLAASVLVQMNYLNRALDLFNTAIVTPIYYVTFTTLTILASAIVLGSESPPSDLLAQAGGFVTVVCGTALLHLTKDLDPALAAAALPWTGAVGLASLSNGAELDGHGVELGVIRSKPY
ncbi:NIPA magnesium transporter [Helicosporidium sp. ATCC 50920]|nr:NIPA magnesium transporter [Helicosporidium sp. ATCC 50920]|eukprot:KDD76433.1 NIPA magnesium transporter [Helicosporidium sp. ATCC 50920]